MFRYELKRTVHSRMFIVVMLLTLAYFVYITVNYFTVHNSSICEARSSASEANAFLAEITASQIGDESLLATLKRDREQTDNEMVRLAELHADDPRNEDGSRSLSPEEIEVRARLMMLLNCVDLIDYQFVQYPELVKTTIEKAVRLTAVSPQNSYVYRENILAIEKYNIVKEFSLLDSSPARLWHEMYTSLYDYFYILLVFAFLFIAADSFCFENTHSTEGIVFTSKHGRRDLFRSKFLSLISIAFAFMLLLTVFDLISAFYIMGGQLMLEPLQVLNTYQSGTTQMNILSFIIVNNIMRFLLIVFTISLAGAVSQISRNVFISAIIDIIIMSVLFAAYIYSSNYISYDDINSPSGVFIAERFTLFERLRIFLPTCLIKPVSYFDKFDYINVANYPFSRMTTCLTVTGVASIVFILFAYFRFGSVLKFTPHRSKAVARKH